jgi:2-haloalkanoic acid dehalogenase type II
MTWDTISFDCYGTLVDWESGISQAFIDAAAQVGLEFERETIIQAYHIVEPIVEAGPFRPYREVLAETALGVADKLNWPLTPEQSGFLAESLPNWPVFEDTRQALERLKSRFQIAILSNVDDDLLAGTIARIGVEFDWRVTAQQIQSYKPAHGHFLEAIRRLEGRPDRLLHAAQSWFHDIIPTSELGLAAVWVNRGGEDLGEDANPLHVVGNLAELAEWLDV